MDMGIEIARWMILFVICLGFIVLGKKVCDQKRQILELENRLQWNEVDFKILLSKVSEVITLNNLKATKK